MEEYKIGQKVWRIDDEDFAYEFEIKSIENDLKSWEILYFDEYERCWVLGQLYASKNELIDAQIAHWESQREPIGEHPPNGIKRIK